MLNCMKNFLASFTRPADTTAYAVGDLVANSTSAGSVVPLNFITFGETPSPSQNGIIRRARLTKSGTTVTNAQFRLHVLNSLPVPVNGDNGALSTTKALGYLGYFDFDMTGGTIFTDGATAIGVPGTGNELGYEFPTSGAIYGLLEARAAYTPASGEVFSAVLETIPGDV